MQEIQRLEMLVSNNDDLDVSYHPDEQYEDELAGLEDGEKSSYGSEEFDDVEDVDHIQG